MHGTTIHRYVQKIRIQGKSIQQDGRNVAQEADRIARYDNSVYEFGIAQDGAVCTLRGEEMQRMRLPLPRQPQRRGKSAPRGYSRKIRKRKKKLIDEQKNNFQSQ